MKKSLRGAHLLFGIVLGVSVLSLLLPSLCLAATTGSISLTNVQIQIIADTSNPRAYIYVTLNGGCGGTTPEIVMNTSTNPAANAMYSTLLTAQATGHNINIITTGCTADANEPEVTSIYLEP